MALSGNLLKLRWGRLSSSRTVGTSYDPVVALGSALKAYWDATDASTYTDDGGGLISSWRDIVGGIDLIAAGGDRPLLTTDFVNGREAILFDGAANFMRAETTAGLPTGAAAGQIWALFETDGPPATGYTVVYGGTASGTVRRVGSSSSERWFISDGSSTSTADGISGSSAGANMSMGRWSGTEQEGRTRGAANPAATAIDSLNTGTTRITFGASNTNTAANFDRIALSAVLITDDTLSLELQQQLESWGYREAGELDVLPAGHPFKEGPDTVATFTSCGTHNFIVARPALQPFLVDFRESYASDFLGQIGVTCLGERWTYAADGSKVLVPQNTAAWLDHDPVSGNPLGLANFSNTTIFNVDRTLATTQIFEFTASGALPTGFFDTNGTLAVYVLGSGQIRLQFDQPVEVLRADGTSETDWGLSAITTSDINIDCVDEHSEGWYSGVHYFKCPRTPPITTVTMSKVGGATVTHAEAVRGVAGPPTLTGISRKVAIMESPFAAIGLPRNLTSFTFCHLVKVSHCTQGGQFFTADDNDLANYIGGPSGLNFQPMRRVAINYLSNPRFDGDKDGFMGVSYCTSEFDSRGIDPEDVVMERMKWRCFFGTGNWLTGELAVSCNGGTVRRATFPIETFPDNLQMIRWMGSYSAGNTTDGWLAAYYFEQASYYNSSDAAIQAMCHPDTSLFGSFDPD